MQSLEPIVTEIVRAALQPAAFFAVVYGAYRKAKAEYAEHAEKVDMIVSDAQRARHILENPAESGIGTANLREVIEHNTRAIQIMTRIIAWTYEKQSGEKLPPYLTGDPRDTLS